MNSKWVAPYTLTTSYHAKVKRRHGFLLKVETDEFKCGYADCFPWPELGDPTADELLEMWKNKQPHRLLERSMYWARQDGLARQEKRFLLDGQENIYNHFLVPDFRELKEQELVRVIERGFKTVKVKLGFQRESEVDKLTWLHKIFGGKIKFRLDFNGKMTKEYIPALVLVKDFVEFIEDPYPEIDDRWWNLAQATKIPLALDQATGGDEARQKNSSLQVIKPAKQGDDAICKKIVVYTSYMDHPVGQACAMAAALAHGKQLLAYGLMSHHVYQATRFSEVIENKSDRFVIPGKYGIGFDQQLENVKWEKLNTF